jgi:hypothetical protein
VALSGLPVVVVVMAMGPGRRSAAVPPVFIVKFGVPVGVRVIVIVVGVGVEVGALRKLREWKGGCVHIGVSMDLCGSTKVKDESGDGGTD